MISSRKPKKNLKEPDSLDHGYDYAIFLLGLRMRTQGEIEFKMRERGYSPKVIVNVTERLLENKYIDDEEYLEVYLNNFKNYGTYGLYMIKKKCIERRLPKDLVDKKLTQLLTEEDEMIIAKRYAEKTLGTSTGIKKLPYEQRQKFLRKLLTRGIRISVGKKLAG